MTGHPASQADAGEQALPLRIESLLQARPLRGLALAPDGGRLAFSVGRGFAVPGEPPQSQIWTWTTGAEASPVTDGPGVHGLARWSPDGGAIAHAASDPDRPGCLSLRILELGSGVSGPVGEVPGSVEDLVWSPDGRSLLVIAEVDEQTGAGPDPRVRRPDQTWRRLYRVDVASGGTSEVGPRRLNVWEIDWRGGRAAAAVVSLEPEESGWYRSFLAALDLEERAATTLHTPRWQIAGPRFSPDGRRVAFLEGICSDWGNLTGVPMIVGSTGSEVAEVAAEVEARSLSWRDDSRLWYAGRHGLRSRCGSFSLDGQVEELWCGEAAVREVSASADGRVLAALVETLEVPPEVAVLDPDRPERGWQPVTSLNAPLVGMDLPGATRMEWQAPDGWSIEGLLVRPRPAPRGRPPLVVVVHGGPTNAWSYAFPCGGRNAALLADAGYAVLLPNPRGSSGRGQEFAQAVVGDLGGAELTDILAGVDACVSAGLADGDRVGIMGASHGGFMAAWAVTQTPRFRASVAIACVSDYLSCHHTSDIAGLDDVLFGGPDRIADYVERSPVTYASRCRTPTLIVHGEDDRCCPLGQAQELYGALVAARVETELVIYPREGHGLVEHDHQVDLSRRVQAWFDRHLARTT